MGLRLLRNAARSRALPFHICAGAGLTPSRLCCAALRKRPTRDCEHASWPDWLPMPCHAEQGTRPVGPTYAWPVRPAAVTQASRTRGTAPCACARIGWARVRACAGCASCMCKARRGIGRYLSMFLMNAAGISDQWHLEFSWCTMWYLHRTIRHGTKHNNTLRHVPRNTQHDGSMGATAADHINAPVQKRAGQCVRWAAGHSSGTRR